MVFVEVLSKVGPLRKLRCKPLTVQVQDQFIKGFDVSVTRFESDLSDLRNHDLPLPEKNLATGKPVRVGDYILADKTYAKLLNNLEKHPFRSLTPALRQDILSFYQEGSVLSIPKDHSRKWKRTVRELEALKAASAPRRIASH